MLVKYCFISITWDELVDGVVLQIEMKKPKVGPYKEPTEAEVKRKETNRKKIQLEYHRGFQCTTTVSCAHK